MFVADTFANKIYVLENSKMKVWLSDPALNGPNGLTIIGNDLIVASLGDVSKGFDKLEPTNIKKIDLTTKAISDFGTATGFGNLDGIELDGKGGVTVTDNPGGRLLDVAPGGRADRDRKARARRGGPRIRAGAEPLRHSADAAERDRRIQG